jgi:hypothetical protein
MQRTVVYECVSLKTEYSGGITLALTNNLSRYVEEGWQIVSVSGGGAVHPAFKSEPTQYAVFAIILEKP